MLQDRYLEELRDPDQSLVISKLINLSGLTASELEQVQSLWNELPAERRHELLSRLSDIADDDPELDFNAVFRIGLHDADSDIRIQAVEGLWECQDRWLID